MREVWDELAADEGAGEKGSAGGWEPPAPLGRGGEIEPFPVWALPAPLAGYVAALATSMQVPADLPGLLALAVVSVCAGGRVRVRVTADWTEPTNVYAVVVLGSGERKSPVFARMLAPIEAVERGLVEDARAGILNAGTRADIARKAAAFLRERASRAGDADERRKLIGEAEQAAEAAAGIEVPAFPRLLAENCTPEALTTLLAEQGGRMAVMSDEGSVFDILAGLYTSGRVSIDVYLKGYSGLPLRVDRVGRQAERIESPALTVGVAVQPAVLARIVANDEFNGRGLLARFLYGVPRSLVGRREINPPPAPQEAASRYHGTITALAEGLTPVTLDLDADARKRLDGFRAELEGRMAESGDLGHIAAWALKLAGQAVRVAGLLHVAARADGSVEEPIDGPTMQAALDIARYASGHAVAAFDIMNADPVLYGARRVLRWIRDRPDPQTSFTRRDAHQGLRAVFETVDAVEPALKLLERRGYIHRRPQEHTGRGRPPSPTFDVNPHDPQERE